MYRERAAPPFDGLRAAQPSEHTRWLTEPDEPALRELLHARYAGSYSYRFLHEPGGASRLWRAGALLSLGEFDAQGSLLWHTGLWCKPGRDSLDSGLSLALPSRRTAMDRSEHERLWSHLLELLKARAGFLHQQTSTLHLMAQRYASRFMRAVPVGLIVDYTEGERLVGVEGSGLPMQALVMTTVLAPLPPRRRFLPAGPWGEWLASILAASGLPGTVELTPLARRPRAGGLVPRPLDWNESLRLERRELVAPAGEGQGATALPSSRARVDLIHLSTGEPQRVAEATPVLLAAGYLPTGLRPRLDAPDDIVFQHLPAPERAREAVGRARLDGEAARALWSGWVERCARTS
ncbi:hypothetical protein [Myxococcus qinghaiensis]|uniref:hypothetical protein n=1 Tax=Myxococcus qinghaiensis TaxID=2906758 RepID=UPI0020A72A2F|nr:hypothetical protein [Myxococcus qinghaiensis]MCP3164388.1 hypothetical protein [Myxococcus qinghaiensis]